MDLGQRAEYGSQTALWDGPVGFAPFMGFYCPQKFIGIALFAKTSNKGALVWRIY